MTASFLPLLEVIGSLVGDMAGIAKAINDNKTVQRQLDELKHHNRVMEGHGVYLAPYKHGQGVSTKKIKKIKKKFKRNDKNAKRHNYQHTLQQLTKRMCISYFYAYLPIKGVYRNESGIVNLDNADRLDTHWVAYVKRRDRVV